MGPVITTAKSMSFETCAEAYITAQAGAAPSTPRSGSPASNAQCFDHRCLAGRGHRYDTGAKGARTDLAGDAGKRLTGARADRKRARLGEDARLSERREPSAVEGPSRKPAGEKAKLAAVVHHAALPHAQIAAFVNTPRRQEHHAASRALEFVILTATRPGVRSAS